MDMMDVDQRGQGAMGNKQQYRCSLCGQVKKGHICSAQRQSSSGSDAESSADRQMLMAKLQNRLRSSSTDTAPSLPSPIGEDTTPSPSKAPPLDWSLIPATPASTQSGADTVASVPVGHPFAHPVQPFANTPSQGFAPSGRPGSWGQGRPNSWGLPPNAAFLAVPPAVPPSPYTRYLYPPSRAPSESSFMGPEGFMMQQPLQPATPNSIFLHPASIPASSLEPSPT
mmetsp:Transcript_24139/g.37914  ORF Transcript_24139/g.37914 Transcript_24139/m.37914 type:complete len:226 (+) Transcript_24139:52-729(+)